MKNYVDRNIKLQIYFVNTFNWFFQAFLNLFHSICIQRDDVHEFAFHFYEVIFQ